jgi:hypothetical protein
MPIALRHTLGIRLDIGKLEKLEPVDKTGLTTGTYAFVASCPR